MYNTVPREDFEKLSALYDGISDGSEEDELVRVLNIPSEMGLNCAGNYGAEFGENETMGAIIDIEAVLKSHGIDLPDASLVSEYIKHDPLDPARQERLGIVDRSGVWGMGIDADHLSIILNNN